MKIIYKLTLGLLSIVLLIVIVGYVSSNTSQKALQKPIEENTISLAVKTLDKIDRNIYNRIEDFMAYSKNLKFLENVPNLSPELKYQEDEHTGKYIRKDDGLGKILSKIG